jgi:hypothetical protein
MSFYIIADAFAYIHDQADMPSHEKWTLVAIANFSHQDGSGAFPSLPTLQRLTSLSRSTLKRAIKGLEHRGALTRVIQRGAHGRTDYTITIPQRVHPDPFKGFTLTPNPVLEPVKRENSGARETYTSRAREGARVGMRQYLTPGSKLWSDLEETLSATNGHRATHA